ncbi:MAG: exodeoxyribonuclease VII large subunit [Firmicutes bacterium]|nr:exodeoxyribonuclease VII large subunit [Bacillota bacterium]
MSLKAIKVSEVNRYIKRILSTDPLLYNIKVEGEISNFKHHTYSGHMYFTLKDDKSRLRCVMFNSDNKKLNLKLEDGMNIVAKGYISIYERDGSYQLYVKELNLKGTGDLYIAFEKLKKKLKQKGYFDDKFKKQIPYIPKKIGVVTSSTGAAVRDIITVIKRRMPCTEIVIYPVLVQGLKSHIEICEGLKYFDQREDIELIITGRGGGSLEELWAFNEEDVANTIFNLKTPIISAVGHETDFTIADFVSDLRAPTPSAAGELAVPRFDILDTKLNEFNKRLTFSMKNIIKEKKSSLEHIKRSKLFVKPLDIIDEYKQRNDYNLKDLLNRMENILTEDKSNLENLGAKLHSLSPLKVLSRGYSIPIDDNENVIKSVDEIEKEEKFNLLMKDGKIKAKVLGISKEEGS